VTATSFLKAFNDGRLRHVMDKIKTASHQDDVLAWLRQNPD